MPSATLRELAEMVGGRVVGSGELVIQNALPPNDADDSGCLTLADSPANAELAEKSKAVAVVAKQVYEGCLKPTIVVDDIHRAFERIVVCLQPQREVDATIRRLPDSEIQISPRANVDDSAIIGLGTVVAPGVTIGNGCAIGKRCVIQPNVTVMSDCQIGDDCVILPGCVLYPGTKLGDRTILHANVVLGGYGFGYRQVDGCHQRAAQVGWVEVGEDVEVGAGSTIDRGAYGPTRIGDGTKIDNQVQIGHNCHIGKHNLICSQVGIAGSCSTGDYVVMGGQVGLADHVHIADRAAIGAQSGLMHDVAAGQVVLGSPATPRKQKLQEWIMVGRLPEMRRDVKQLLDRVASLETAVATSGENTAEVDRVVLSGRIMA